MATERNRSFSRQARVRLRAWALAALLLAPAAHADGTLLIVGGALAEDNAAVHRALIESLPPEGMLVIIPAASGRPARAADDFTQSLVRHGLARERIARFPLAVRDDSATPDVDESTWRDNAWATGHVETYEPARLLVDLRPLTGHFNTLPELEASLAFLRPFRDRIGLVSAAVSDHSWIDQIALELRKMGARLTASSMRVDPISEPLIKGLAESGNQTLTIAPEAGSVRLRQVINKPQADAQILHLVQALPAGLDTVVGERGYRLSGGEK